MPNLWKLYPSPETEDAAKAYIDTIADLMGLGDWDIVLHFKLPQAARAQMRGSSDDYDAWLEPVDGRRAAALWLPPNWYAASPADQRHTIVHELLHCHHAAEELLVRDELEHLLESFAVDVLHVPIHRWWSQANEYAVDAISVAWAAMLPQPAWPKGTPKLEHVPPESEYVACPLCHAWTLDTTLYCDQCDVHWDLDHLPSDDRYRIAEQRRLYAEMDAALGPYDGTDLQPRPKPKRKKTAAKGAK